MTRVLHIVYSFYHGGAEHLIATIAGESRGRGVEHGVCVLTSGGQPLDRLASSGTAVHVMGKQKGAQLSMLPRLVSLIRTESPDILHLHNSSGGLWGTAAVLAGRLCLPVVRTEHRPWIPEELPLVHRSTWPFLARRASSIIAVSEHARKTYTSAFPSLASRIVTVHNGIDTGLFGMEKDRESAREWFGLPEKAFIIGTIGRLVPVKDHALLIEAFGAAEKEIPGAHLAILGQGPLEGDLRRQARAEGVDGRLSILPASPAVPRFLGAVDVFVLPSLSEGLPLTLLEAAASSLPVVASRVGGIPEVIEHGVNGLLVEAGSAPELAGSLVSLARSPGRMSSLGEAARRTVLERFTAAACCEKTLAVYENVLAAP